MSDPTLEKTTETRETTKASTETAAAAVISLAPAVVADDSSRWWLGLIVILQFLALVGYIVFSTKTHEATNAEMMVLGAEIGFITTLLNYYYGSSSGSTAKSAMLEKGK